MFAGEPKAELRSALDGPVQRLLLRERLSNAVQEALFLAEHERHHQLVLRGEVAVYGLPGHRGLAGHVLDRGPAEPDGRHTGEGRVQDPLRRLALGGIAAAERSGRWRQDHDVTI